MENFSPDEQRMASTYWKMFFQRFLFTAAHKIVCQFALEERFHKAMHQSKFQNFCRFVLNLYRATRWYLRFFCKRYINYSKSTAKCISFLKVIHLHLTIFFKTLLLLLAHSYKTK